MSVELDFIIGPIYKDIPGFPYYRAGIDGTIWTQYEKVNYGGNIRIITELRNTWRKAPIIHTDINKNKYLRINLWDE